MISRAYRSIALRALLNTSLSTGGGAIICLLERNSILVFEGRRARTRVVRAAFALVRLLSTVLALRAAIFAPRCQTNRVERSGQRA